MFKIRLKDIPPDGLDRELPLDGPWFAAALAGIDGAWDGASGCVRLNLSRQGLTDVLARGDVRVRFTVPCARCLEPAAVAVDADFAATFVPRGSARADHAEDEPDVQGYAGDEIDVGDLVREQVLLGVPMTSLCRPECQGLCPQCGAELNAGPCGCGELVDPRWSALKGLKPEA
jgi:uncharacterized protein